MFFSKSSDNWRLLICFAVCACNDFAWTWGLGAGCASDYGWWVALCLPVCLSACLCLLICSCLFLCFFIDKGREFSGHGQLWLGTVLFLWKQMLVQLKEKGWLFDCEMHIYIYIYILCVAQLQIITRKAGTQQEDNSMNNNCMLSYFKRVLPSQGWKCQTGLSQAILSSLITYAFGYFMFFITQQS